METLSVIARIKNDYISKFGIPRQSNLVGGVRSAIVFEREYRSAEAVRGLEAFSHLWLIWGFSHAEREGWSPTVRPPRLGGNVRIGVFASRSPFRPNSLGLSSVVLEKVELGEEGPVLWVKGADLMSGTPIYDIKPYLPYTDSHPNAAGGFSPGAQALLTVDIPRAQRAKLDDDAALMLKEILAQDPRPSYHEDPQRVYGMEFGEMEIKFSVDGEILTVREITARKKGG